MQEADVVKIVESSIAKKNEGLLAAMKSMLDNSLADFKRSHADTADTELKYPSQTELAAKQVEVCEQQKGTFRFNASRSRHSYPTFSATVQDLYQQFSLGLKPNRVPVIPVTSQDIRGHSVLSILPSSSLVND